MEARFKHKPQPNVHVLARQHEKKRNKTYKPSHIKNICSI